METPYIVLTLRNPFNKEELLPLEIDLFWDRSITRKWFGQLKASLRAGAYPDKEFSFLGFPDGHRDVKRICAELEEQRKVINRYFSRWLPNRMGYHIAERFSRETVIENGRLNQDLMNRLHHHFELLSGQIWNESQYKKRSPAKVKYAIHRLNQLCHELETLIQQFEDFDRGEPQPVIRPWTLFSFFTPQHLELEDEDLERFEYRQEFGLVSLHYSQIGKKWDEAYFDQDTHVFDSGISGLRYYSGEFDIFWGKGHDLETYQEEESRIHRFMRERGVNSVDKRNALGWLYVGKVDRERHFPEMSIAQIQSLLTRYLDLYQIQVHDRGEVILRVFEDCETDPGYSRRLMKHLKKHWR